MGWSSRDEGAQSPAPPRPGRFSPGTSPASVLAPHSGARARGLEGRHFGGGTAGGSTTAGTARFPPSTTGVLSSVAGRAWQGDGLQTQAPGRVVVV